MSVWMYKIFGDTYVFHTATWKQKNSETSNKLSLLAKVSSV